MHRHFHFLLVFLFLFYSTVSLAQQPEDILKAWDESYEEKASHFHYSDSIYLNQPLYPLLNDRLFIGGYVGLKAERSEYQGERLSAHADISQLSPIIQFQLANLRMYYEMDIDLLNFNGVIYDLWAAYRIRPWLGVKAGYFKVPNSYQNIHRAEASFRAVDRVQLGTEILASNYSDLGLGLEGDFFTASGIKFSYQMLGHLGYNEQILYTAQSYTYLHWGTVKEDFRMDNNEALHLTCYIDIAEEDRFNLGGSISSGNYSNTENPERMLSTYSIHSAFHLNRISLRAEAAGNRIELPSSISELYGSEQYGLNVGLGVLLLDNKYVQGNPTALKLNLQYDYIDYNYGVFTQTKENIGDEVSTLYLGLSYHYNQKSAVKVGAYRFWERDLLSNPTLNGSGLQVAVASYF